MKILAHAHQTLIWLRGRHLNQLRSTLREFYPAALEAPGTDLAGRDALALMSCAPMHEQGSQLSLRQLRSVLLRGRQRGVDARALELQQRLRATVAATTTVGESLRQFGDDRTRYQDARARRCDAGSAPITRASGTRRVVLARIARNRRLADALYLWAFCTLTQSPGARALHSPSRARPHHHQALRALANRLVGILHGCLEHVVSTRRTSLGHPLTKSPLDNYPRGMSRHGE